MLFNKSAVQGMNLAQARAALTLLLLMSEPSMSHEDAALQIDEVTDTESVEQVRSRVLIADEFPN